MQKLCNGGRTNLSEWVKNIVDELFEEKVIKEHTFLNDTRYILHDDLHNYFLCTIPTLQIQVHN